MYFFRYVRSFTFLLLWGGAVMAQAQTNLGPIKVTTQESIGTSTAPVLPAGSDCKSYYDLTSGQMKWINSGGASCGPTGGGGGNQIPGYSTAQYGTTGNGSTDDTSAFQAAVTACPQTSPAIGCDIYAPAGLYKFTSAVSVAALKSVRLHGSGSGGTGGCGTIIQTNGAIYGFTVGSGSPDSNGFQIENVCFQDMTGNGLGGIYMDAIRDVYVANVTCFKYFVGACLELDGAGNFTQFSPLINISTWQTKYRIQTANKTASFHVIGGEGNCQNNGSTDVISGSIDIDLGYTNHSAATGTATEWWVSSQTQNCQIGRAMFNAGGNRFFGDKGVEETINARPNGSFCVIVDGDTPSLANGNTFEGEQCTKAGTAFYIKPNTSNTSISLPIFNGTNGVDFVGDSTALGSVRDLVNKRLTGWQTNISAITRASNVVTATTTANSDNGDLAIVAGTRIEVFGVTGGTLSFDGKFSVVSSSTNDSTNITTLTWNQTGANESGTINTAGCNGLGSCVAPLSTVQTSGVGVAEFSGDQVTQNVIYQIPTIPNQETFNIDCPSTTACTFFDGAFLDVNEGGNGWLHWSDGPVVSYNGNASGSYAPQPMTFAGGSGTVNTSGTAVTYNSGNVFGLTWTGTITINNVVYAIATVNNATTITLTTSAGTQTGVNYEASGIAGVPNCGNPSGGFCLTADDKGFLYANNTNGSTYCLPPPGAANGYPAGFRQTISFAPGTGGSPFSITPPGVTSSLGVTCPGSAGPLFDGSPTFTNITNLQGMVIYTDGSNWKSSRGAPNVTLDQIANSLSSTATNLNPLKSGSFNGGGSGANNGQDWIEQGGSSNSTGGRGADRIVESGPDSASGTNGAAGVVQTAMAGNGLGSKNGFIVRACKDVAGTDCVTQPAGNSGAVRLTISGTDVGPAFGIVYSGSGSGSPVQIQVSGVYGHSLSDGAIVETSCTMGQFYEIAETNASDNGAGQCTATDSPRRVGIALLTTSGTCNSSTPCHVPILIQPAAGIGQLIQKGTDAACTTTCTETFPIPYQSAVPTCFCTGINGSCNVQTGGNSSKTTCAFNASASGGINWQAIGPP